MTVTYVTIAPDATQDGGLITFDNGGYDVDPVSQEPVSKVPPGTCGLRWHDPGVWYWRNAGAGKVASLPSSSTAGSPHTLEFSGPYKGCKTSEYVFPPPLTENGKAPLALATTLIVQVPSSEDIEYLDSQGAAVYWSPDEDPWPPDPDPPSLCEMTPEFCDPKKSWMTFDPCGLVSENPFCGKAHDVQRELGNMAELAAAATRHLRMARRLFRMASSPAAGVPLRDLLQRSLIAAQQQLAMTQSVEGRLNESLRELKGSMPSDIRGPLTPALLERLARSAELAAECTGLVKTDIDTSVSANSADALVMGRAMTTSISAARSVDDALRAAMQLHRWAFLDQADA